MANTRLADAYVDPKTRLITEEIPAPLISKMAIEGAGTRGWGYRVALKLLRDAKVLDAVDHFVGTSIGGISAMLMALGFTDDEIDNLLLNFSFEDLIEEAKSGYYTPELLKKGQQVWAIFRSPEFSLSKGGKILKWIEDRIEEKLGNREANFEDLAKIIATQDKNNPRFKYLTLAASDLSKNRAVFFDHEEENDPKIPIGLAVFASAAVPWFINPVKYKGHVYADGAMSNNLAANRFNDEDMVPKNIGFNKKGANVGTLCLKMDNAEEMEELLWRNGYPRRIKSIKDYTKAVIDVMGSRDAEFYDLYSTNIIQIFDANVEMLKLKLTTKDKELMETYARMATMEWLETHYNEGYAFAFYKSEQEWLASKKYVEDVKEIRQAYEAMLETEIPEDEKIKIKNKIEWLKKYIKYRCDLIQDIPTEEIVYTEHVDLVRPRPRQAMDNFIKQNLQNKLQIVEKEKIIVDNKIERLLSRINCDTSKLHNNADFDQVAYLAKLQDKRKHLTDMYYDLMTKLNKPCPLTRKSSPHLSNCLYVMQQQLYEYSQNKPPKATINSKLLPEMDKHLRGKIIDCMSNDGIEMHLDLRDGNDAKLYLLALLFYLRHTNTHHEVQKIIAPYYKQIFGDENIPKNLAELGNYLKLSKVDLHLAAYKLEALYNSFKKLDMPYENSYVCIDYVFEDLSTNKFRKFKFLKKKKEVVDEQEIELDFIASSCNTTLQQFTIFKTKSDVTSLVEDENLMDLFDSDDELRCLRRLT